MKDLTKPIKAIEFRNPTKKAQAVKNLFDRKVLPNMEEVTIKENETKILEEYEKLAGAWEEVTIDYEEKVVKIIKQKNAKKTKNKKRV